MILSKPILLALAINEKPLNDSRILSYISRLYQHAVVPHSLVFLSWPFIMCAVVDVNDKSKANITEAWSVSQRVNQSIQMLPAQSWNEI